MPFFKKNMKWVDYSYSILDVILTSLSMVLVHDAANFLPPALTLFVSTFIAILFFHLVNIKQIKHIYKKSWQMKKAWFKLMFTVALMWLASIYGPAYVPPAVFILHFFASMCLIGTCVSFGSEKDPYLAISGIGILICTLFITYDYLNAVVISKYILLGIFLGLSGGVTAFLYLKQSHEFSRLNQFSATQVLAVRFWLVEFFCLLLLPFASLHYLNFHNLLLITGIAFTSLILPIFMVMQSILKIGVQKSVIISGLIPATTYIMQSIFFHQFYTATLLLNLAFGFFIVLPDIVNLIKKLRHMRHQTT